MKRLVLTLLIVAALAAPAPAVQLFEKVGTVGFQFLEIGAGPRGVGMGGAMVGAAEGVESLYWNPAGLRTISRPTAIFSYGTWPAEITHQYFGYVMRPGFVPGVLGISVTTLQMEPMLVRTADSPEGVGVEFDAGDIAVGITYTRVLTDRFAAGGTLKWFHSGLGDLTPLNVEGLEDYFVEGACADFGTLYNTGFRSLKIGLMIQNMGPGRTYIEEEVALPITFKFGVSMNVFDTPGQKVLVSAEFRHPSDTSEKINLGAEYSLNEMYFLRAGYKLNYDEESFTAGGGARVCVGSLGQVGVDYAYSDFGHLGAVHRMGLTLMF